MITRLMEEINARLEQLNDICKSKDYFKDFEEKADLISKRIDKSNEKIEELEEENEELKRVLNEIKKLVDNYERAEQILGGKTRFQLNKLQEILDKVNELGGKN